MRSLVEISSCTTTTVERGEWDSNPPAILGESIEFVKNSLEHTKSESIWLATISVNWDKIQSMSQGMVSTLAHTLTDTGQISTIAGNLGIPLTGGLAAGFAIGVMKG